MTNDVRRGTIYAQRAGGATNPQPGVLLSTARTTMRDTAQPLYFDEVQVGDQWQSPRRTVTEADIVIFAGLTGDYNPLHIDHEFARETPFGKPIAHGLLGLAWVAGLGSNCPLMRTDAFVRIVEWRFLKPMFVGDTVHVATEILAVQPSGRKRGLITWQRRLLNQSGSVVQEGTFETLVRRSPAKRSDEA